MAIQITSTGANQFQIIDNNGGTTTYKKSEYGIKLLENRVAIMNRNTIVTIYSLRYTDVSEPVCANTSELFNGLYEIIGNVIGATDVTVNNFPATQDVEVTNFPVGFDINNLPTTQDVHVTNTPAVTISGTPNVSVTNTPTVNISPAQEIYVTNTPDVNVVNYTDFTPPITKGTQDSVGFTVQALKDAGRTNLRFYAVAASAGTTGTETAITLTKSSGTSATSTATSFVITSGKIFRIESITFATRGHSTATAQSTTFNFRINTGGAVTTTSTPVIISARCATPATASAWDRHTVSIPDGLEFSGNGTIQFGITAAATYTTNAPTWDVLIIGFEY